MRSKHIENHADELSNYEQQITEYFRYWLPILGLDNWARVEVSCNPDNPGNGVLGETCANWRYMEADITFYLGGLVGASPEPRRMEYIVLHELCHCMVNEMRDENSADDDQIHYLIPHEERTVSNLAMAFMRSKYEGKTEVKKKGTK